MKKEYIKLKETELNNNCPECFNTDGMVLTFKQEQLRSKFLIKNKQTIIDHIECKKCESVIYPGIWTDDIERVHAYHKKTVTLQSPSLQLRPMFYIVVLVIILLLSTGYVYLNHPEVLGL